MSKNSIIFPKIKKGYSSHPRQPCVEEVLYKRRSLKNVPFNHLGRIGTGAFDLFITIPTIGPFVD